MKRARFAGITFLVACLSFAATTDNPSPGRKAEQGSCLPCHSLRLVESQRLSAATWQKEVDKMIGWGAVVPDRQVLIDYLSQHYGDNMPPLSPVLSVTRK